MPRFQTFRTVVREPYRRDSLAAVMATNPPIQIGELVDVPAPGSGRRIVRVVPGSHTQDSPQVRDARGADCCVHRAQTCRREGRTVVPRSRRQNRRTRIFQWRVMATPVEYALGNSCVGRRRRGPARVRFSTVADDGLHAGGNSDRRRAQLSTDGSMRIPRRSARPVMRQFKVFVDGVGISGVHLGGDWPRH